LAQKLLHSKIIEKQSAIIDWYKSRKNGLGIPIYSSYDIRDAGYKITNVDANIYPAGFNNICQNDKEHAWPIFKNFLKRHYGESVSRILLVTEEHTNNPYYWDNVYTIQSLLEEGGFKVLVGLPSKMEAPLTLQSASGHTVKVVSADLGGPAVQEFKPELIISNNDFSVAHTEWAEGLDIPMNPPRELGWYQRKKSRYFKLYNQLVAEFSQVAGVDPFLLNVKTEVFENFDIGNDESRNELATRVDAMLGELRVIYKERGIQQEPFVFVKNNSGTYGLAVIRVSNGDEVRAWNYKSKKKMKAAKGGRDVEEVIIQEGIPSVVQKDGATAEPVIYMIGCELAGGFLRTHSEKSSEESLNSPGAVYKRLCMSDLGVSAEGCPQENVYGWSAKLGLLAIALEAQEMNVKFNGFSGDTCNRSY
jgi:glutamate--cysteine ligase